MKKMKKLAVLTAVLVVVSIMLGACGSSLKDDPAVGSWEMTEVEYAGQTLSASDLSATGMMDEMPTLEIKDDGSCTFTFMEANGTGEVGAKGDGKYEITDDSDTVLNFEIKNDKLRLDYSQMSMVMIFEK